MSRYVVEASEQPDILVFVDRSSYAIVGARLFYTSSDNTAHTLEHICGIYNRATGKFTIERGGLSGYGLLSFAADLMQSIATKRSNVFDEMAAHSTANNG